MLKLLKGNLITVSNSILIQVFTASFKQYFFSIFYKFIFVWEFYTLLSKSSRFKNNRLYLIIDELYSINIAVLYCMIQSSLVAIEIYFKQNSVSNLSQ